MNKTHHNLYKQTSKQTLNRKFKTRKVEKELPAFERLTPFNLVNSQNVVWHPQKIIITIVNINIFLVYRIMYKFIYIYTYR